MCFFFVPLISYFPGRQKESDLKKENGEEIRGVSRIIGQCATFISGSKIRWVGAMSTGALFLICLGLVSQIDPGMDLTYAIHNYLTKSWKNSKLYHMEMNIKERFKTIYPCNIMIQTKEEGGLKEPEILSKMDKFANFLTKRHDIGGCMHLGTFIKVMHRFVHEEKDEYFKIPEIGKAISEYLYLYDMADPGSFEFIVDHDYQNSVLIAYADNTSQQTVKEILESAKSYAEREFNDDKVVAKIAGGAIGICGACNEMIKKWIILATILSLIASFIIAAILFTSLLAPIYLMIPLLFGTIVTVAVLFITGIEINSNASTVCSMGIGVGIDAGVYLLFRFREEFANLKEFQLALFKSFATSGKALLFSFSALVLGCWSVIPVPLYIGYVGYAMGLILFMNFIFTFTLLPALWSIFKPQFLFK